MLKSLQLHPFQIEGSEKIQTQNMTQKSENSKVRCENSTGIEMQTLYVDRCLYGN